MRSLEQNVPYGVLRLWSVREHHGEGGVGFLLAPLLASNQPALTVVFFRLALRWQCSVGWIDIFKGIEYHLHRPVMAPFFLLLLRQRLGKTCCTGLVVKSKSAWVHKNLRLGKVLASRSPH